MESDHRIQVSRRVFLRTCGGALLLGAGATVLAACVPSGPSAPAQPAVQAGSSASPVARGVTITYWTPLDHSDPGPRSRAEVEMVNGFRARHPEISVTVQTVPWQKMDTQIIQAAAAGKSPDVAQLSTFGLPMHVPAGSLKPLDDYVGRSWSAEERQDWLLPIENTRYDGNQMAYYWNSLVYDVFWYRKDLLADKGLAPPRTWDDLAQVGRALSSERTAGFVIGLSRDGDAISLTSWLLPALWTIGADWLDEQQQVAFNTDKGAQAFQWLVDMFLVHQAIPMSAVSATRDNMLDGFKAGTAAMTVMQSNVVSSARTARSTGEQLGIGVSPGVDASTPMAAFAGGKFLVMGKDVREPQAAGLFMEYVLSPEAQLINARIANEPPSRKSVLKDAWFATPEAADLKLVLEYMAAHPRPFRYHEKHNRLADMVATATQQMVSNRKPVREALDAVAAQWQAALKS